MFSIALTLDVIQPFAVARRRITKALRAIMALFRFGLGVVVGVTIYAVATGLFTSVCSPSCAQAPFIYAFGIFLGAALCVPAVTLAAPDKLTFDALPWTSAAVILLPAGVFSHSAASGGWQPAYMIYLAATFFGGVAGTNLTLHALATRRRIRVLA